MGAQLSAKTDDDDEESRKIEFEKLFRAKCIDWALQSVIHPLEQHLRWKMRAQIDCSNRI